MQVYYETPNGVRRPLLYAGLDAADEDRCAFRDHFGVDPLHRRMGRLQKRFGTRVGPKTWRAGLRDHFRAGGTRQPDA